MKFVLALLFAAGWSCFADELLKIGDPAPELTIERWMRGEPVQKFEKGKVYVVEFWATWCGPCVRMMPHLVNFQKKYADQGLRVIGVASREDTKDRVVAEDRIEKFLDDKFPEINYAIAFEHGGVMNKTWLEPGLARGIPHSFVVDREGNVAFIGHPAFLDSVLPAIFDGTYDYEEARKKDEERVQRDRPQIESRKVLKPILAGKDEAVKNEDWNKALTLVEAAIAVSPEDPQLQFERVELLLHRVRDFTRGFKSLAESAQHAASTGVTYFLAMGVKLLYEPGKDYSYLPEKERKEQARDMAEKYLTLPANGGNTLGFILYLPLAEYYNQVGEPKRAQEILESAVEQFEKLDDPEYKPFAAKKYMAPMARMLADLKNEPVCIGDLCVLPSSKSCESSASN